MRLVWDVESDGFRDEATQLWCICAVDADTDKLYAFGPDELDKGLDFIYSADELIGHNTIDFDHPIVKDMTGREYTGKITDTLILSKLLRHNRKRPQGLTGKAGPHSVEAWALRLGTELKVQNDVWTEYHPTILERCKSDVRIQLAIYRKLVEEAGDHDWSFANWIETEFAKAMTEQADYRVKVNRTLIDQHIVTLAQIIEEIDEVLIPMVEPWPHAKGTKLKAEKRGEWVKFAKEQELWITEVPDTDLVEYFGECEYTFIKKPKTVKGEYAKAVKDWFGPDTHLVEGPCTKVDWIKPDLDSTQQLKEWLLSIGWKPIEYTDKGSPRLTEDSYDSIPGLTGMLAGYRMKARHRKSLLEGLLKHVKEDDSIRAEGNTLGTSTGRVSHRKVVNIPGHDAWFGDQCREVFVAREGYLFASADANSCQLRLLCEYMGDPEYTELVLAGKMHDRNMEILSLVKRQAKAFIYALLFGAGDAKLGAIKGGGASEGTELRQKFMTELPALAQLIDNLKQVHKLRPYLLLPDGRKLWVFEEKDLLVYLMQGVEAILMKLAAIFVCSWIKQGGWDAHMVIHYHDEYTFEVREDQAEAFAPLLGAGIEEAGKYLQLTVPMNGSPQVGKNWGEIH